MPQFKIFAHPLAVAPDKVLILLAEAGFTDYEYVSLDLLTGEHKKPELLAHNPHGRVPFIVTADGVSISESQAISRYLATRYNLPFLPPTGDHLALARFEETLSWGSSYFMPPAETVVYQTFVHGLMGLETDDAAVAEAKKKLEAYFDICEAQFEKTGHKFMAGDYYSLVDINYIPQLARMFDRGFGDVIEARPHVKAWWERCLARPATGQYVREKIPKYADAMKLVQQAKPAEQAAA